MARSTWTIEVELSNGAWDLDTSIYRPNEDLETETVSTESVIKLANGEEAYVAPETKYLKSNPFNMFWADTTSAFRTQIETYIMNRDKVRITTHSGEKFIGRFISMRRVWFTGSEDTFDVQISFRRIQ